MGGVSPRSVEKLCVRIVTHVSSSPPPKKCACVLQQMLVRPPQRTVRAYCNSC